MNCRYCGTALPEGAMFCGECGQPVSAAAVTASATTSMSSARSMRAVPVPPAAAGASIAELAFSSPGVPSERDHDALELPDGARIDPEPIDGAESLARCPQCGEPMAAGDVFCGECGFVVRTVAPPAGPADDDQTDDDQTDDDETDETTEVEPLPTADAGPAPDGRSASESEPEDQPTLEPSIDELVIEAGPAAAAEPVGAELDLDEPLPFAVPAAEPAASPRSRPIHDPFPWGADRPLREDIEATRLVADPASGTRYVLQFSTGESVTVAGSGLVGRNPTTQPGEYVDQLVPIFDAGKSVSKTHLQFGQEAGRFWVSDRYSTNGSVIRQPEAEPRRCDPGRRYFIARGSRVDLGEQFFVVS